MQAVEQKVRGAADSTRARTAPENPMVTSMRAAVTKAEEQLAKAEAAGDARRIERGPGQPGHPARVAGRGREGRRPPLTATGPARGDGVATLRAGARRLGRRPRVPARPAAAAAAGHEVFTPSLTGIGERVAPGQPAGGPEHPRHRTWSTSVLYEDLDDDRPARVLLRRHGRHRGAGAHRATGCAHWSTSTPSSRTTVSRCTACSAQPADRAAAVRATPWLVDGPRRAYDDPAEAAFSVPRRTPHPVRLLHRAGAAVPAAGGLPRSAAPTSGPPPGARSAGEPGVRDAPPRARATRTPGATGRSRRRTSSRRTVPRSSRGSCSLELA